MSTIFIEIERGKEVISIPIASAFLNRFERRHGLGSLERLFRLFATNCLSFEEIGKSFSLTRERIRQLHKKYFSAFSPEKNGRERMRSCTIARARRLKLPQPMLRAWREARRRGLSVTRYVVQKKEVRISKNTLVINDNLCRIHSVNAVLLLCPWLAHGSITRGSADHIPYHAFILADRLGGSSFIIPSNEFSRNLNFYPHTRNGVVTRQAKIYLAIQPHPGTTKRWEKYRDAWHQLSESPKPTLE